MRRTTTLTAAAMLGLALLAPTTSADAAGETCRGEAATIVGTGGSRTLWGTDGRDVVLTNGSATVNTRGGDDVVCVTGRAASDGSSVRIDAGTGNDLVDATTSSHWSVAAELGQGADTFRGGDFQSFVMAGIDDSEHTDTEVDVITGGPGADYAYSGTRGGANGDVIDLAGGDDSLWYAGDTTPEGSVRGGAGSDWLTLALSTGRNLIDNVSGRLVVRDDTIQMTWAGFERFYTLSPAGVHDLEFVGGEADEMIVDQAAEAGTATIALGGGDDQYLGRGAPAAGSTFNSGAGNDDRFYLASESVDLDLDLASGRLDVGAATPYSLGVSGFDGASLFAPEVAIRGTAGVNELEVTACRGVVRGGGGDDTIFRGYDGMFETDLDCAERLDLSGGAGDDDLHGGWGNDLLSGGSGRDALDGGRGKDRLLGGTGADVLSGRDEGDTLLGGPGRDRADGGVGRDRCVAEAERRCER